MAYGSYLQRRDGRFSIQFRWRKGMAVLAERQLYRAALRTTDACQARLRLGECMGWVLRMNDAVDFVSLFQKNVVQLQSYLQDAWPIADERLYARQNYAEMLKNLNRRARAQGYDPTVAEPDFFPLFNRFVQQNTDAEAWSRKRESLRVYEQGRADMRGMMQAQAVPSSFAQAESQAVPNVFRGMEGHQPVGGPPQSAPVANTEPPAVPAAVPLPTHLENAELATRRFSSALAEFLVEDEAAGNNADARSLAELLVRFVIEALGDPVVSTFGPAETKALDHMLPDIPNRKGVPRASVGSLALRYAYAREHGWEKLTRLTEARIRHYHNELSKFFGWLIAKGYYLHPKPVFNALSAENLVSFTRDAFLDEEALTIVRQPLFTGCHSAAWIWKPGRYFVQSHLYWAYILLFLTGLRPGELGQIELDDIRQGEDGIDYLFIRPFDPAKGRVARKDVKRFKTSAASRIIPLHPLIIELGLLERIADLKALRCSVLFPEWQPYPKPGGTLRWGQPITKSWQHLKKVTGITRADVTLYSTRHWFGDLIDNTDIKHATRLRVMGHKQSKDVPGRYGAKTRLTTRDLAQIVTTPSPIIDAMSEVLLAAKARADRGELTVLRPWRLRENWSEHFREQHLG